MKNKSAELNSFRPFLGVKKIALSALLILGMFFVRPIQAQAAGEAVTIASASAASSSVSVSGTTDALAVMCQVRDADDNIVAMTSLAVNGGSFSGTISTPALSAGATYTLYVADYEGGTFAKQELTAPAASSGGSQDSGSSSGSTSQSVEDKTAQPVKMEYVVVKGDTLRKIAWKLGVTFDSLIKWNTFKNVNLIYPGQKIIYYTGQSSLDNKKAAINKDTEIYSDSKGNYYVVKKGDYLYKIVKKLNVTLEYILKMNIFKNINLIFPGQKIYY